MREKHIKKDMEEMKKRYDTLNEKMGSLETRMDQWARIKLKVLVPYSINWMLS